MTERTTKQGVQNHTRDVNAAQRASLAIKLRAQKVKYEEIARMCGYGSAGAAHKAVMRELERTVVEDVNKLRKEESDSLDQLELECWKRLYDKEYTKSKMFAVDRIIAIKERRARMMGLDVKTDDAQIAPSIVIQEVPMGYLEAPKND